MTRLLIVRHGQAVCNVERTIEGVATCRGLSPLGHRQAAALAERLRREDFHPDVTVVSPIRRARQTADHIAVAIGCELRLDAELEEVRPGEAEGMTWDQYSAFFGSSEGWDPNVAFAPGAEAWSEFAIRVSKAIDRVCADHVGQTVLLVAHGGVVDSSVFHFFGLNPHVQSPIDFETTNTSITEWRRNTFTPLDASPVHRWRMVRYNDAAHLPAGDDNARPQGARRSITHSAPGASRR